MDRKTRDKFAAATPQTDLLYGEQACQETPKGLVEVLEGTLTNVLARPFTFDLDLFANEENHTKPLWFGPGSPVPNGFNALAATWWWPGSPTTVATKNGFGNPPYGGFITSALKKAIEEQAKGFTSALLLPLRAARWYKNLVLPYYSHLWHVESRLMFTYHGQRRQYPNEKGKLVDAGALFDSIIVVFAPRQQSWLPGFPPQRPNVWNPKTGELRY